MLCPKCGDRTKTVETRGDGTMVVRMRVCAHCGKRFITVEKEVDYALGADLLNKQQRAAKIRSNIKKSNSGGQLEV